MNEVKSMSSEEKVEDTWNYIAHAYALDADNPEEVKARLQDKEWEFEWEWIINCVKEYNRLRKEAGMEEFDYGLTV